jgi:elongation factor Tu
MTTDSTFHMIVEDVFSIRNRGTVVTGKIDMGSLKTGDEVVVRGRNGDKKTTVTGIEAFKKILDQANAGENVGLLLKDLTRQDVQKGDEIIAPGEDFTWKP